MSRTIVAGCATVFALLTGSSAVAAEPLEIGPCADEDAIVIQVGQTAKVCAHLIDRNECDANDIVITAGGRTVCVKVP
jgi:hypothetical protein